MLSTEYIAGFFDGEGCIYHQPGKERQARLRVTISQNDRRPLDLVAERFGGKVRLHRPGHWRWEVYTQQAEAFLREVRPFLIVKEKQASEALLRRANVRSYYQGQR